MNKVSKSILIFGIYSFIMGIVLLLIDGIGELWTLYELKRLNHE